MRGRTDRRAGGRKGGRKAFTRAAALSSKDRTGQGKEGTARPSLARLPTCPPARSPIRTITNEHEREMDAWQRGYLLRKVQAVR